MRIKLNKKPKSILLLMRRLGYHSDNRLQNKSYSRLLRGGKFPRFHIYYNKEENQINLHLDQKAPRYKNANDHGGEYDGKIVEEEAERIKNILS
jgi:hypothetical protein